MVDLIRDPEDIWTLTYEIAREMAAQQVRYAELTLTPYSSIVRGIAAEAFCEAVEDARRRARTDLGIALAWCFDIPGEAGLPAADLTLDVALQTTTGRPGQFRARRPRDRGVPREQFAPHFARPAPPACTAFRTPASRPDRRRSGTR